MEEVHNGYFSIDRKGGWTDTSEGNQGSRDNAERAYNLIMKDKERLLSFETPLKFIFSHSALKEGWDNPNVFQICTLRDMQTEQARRQTIGRGLRLCVNQEGERLRGFAINTLTVIATESYEQFAAHLQREIEADTGIRFGVVEAHQFATITVAGTDGQAMQLGVVQSKALWEHLKDQGYLDAHGKVQDALKQALQEGTLALPSQFAAQAGQIAEILRKVSGRLEIKNADERQQVRSRQAVLNSPEFTALWERIKSKTTYRVQFDNEDLVAQCTRALRDAPPVGKTRLEWRKAGIAIGRPGVETHETETAAPTTLAEENVELPDVLTELQDRTQLTRRTIQRILAGSGRLGDFTRNPQQFIDVAAEAINRCKRLAVVDGIRYQRLGDDEYYAQELFANEELTGYLRNMLDSQKSVYEQVVYDSQTEAAFASQLELNTAIKVYAKLPGWFTVPTPLGAYNPDWAVVAQTEAGDRLYLVVETKSSLFADDLRDSEGAKIACGKAHFRALHVSEAAAQYVVERSVEELLAQVGGDAPQARQD